MKSHCSLFSHIVHFTNYLNLNFNINTLILSIKSICNISRPTLKTKTLKYHHLKFNLKIMLKT